MIRFLLFLVLLIAGIAGAVWYSSQSLPSWYDQGSRKEAQIIQQVSEQINRQGAGLFLLKKYGQAKEGRLVLSQAEFNALLIVSLKSSRGGRRLLGVSNAVHAELGDDYLEIGAVVNLNKVAKVNVRAKEVIEKLTVILPFLDKSKMFLAISGKPVARDGDISFDKDFTIKIGSIPVSSDLLELLGIPVEGVANANFPMKYLSVKSVELHEDEIRLQILPRF